jgi:hypothetical protein
LSTSHMHAINALAWWVVWLLANITNNHRNRPGYYVVSVRTFLRDSNPQQID